MAYHESEYFTPDKIDEQIATSLDEAQAAQPLDPPGTQVVQMLQHHYTPVNDYDQPLARVWNRLKQHRASLRPSHNEEASRNGLPLYSAAQPAASNRQQRASFASRLALIAAIIFIPLLVGSTVAVFQLTRPGHGSGSVHSTPTSRPTVHPPAKTANTDQIYVIVNNTLYRYDATTHQPLWSFQMPVPNQAENIGSRAQVVGGIVYMLGTGSDGYYSYALNASDGSVRWRYKVQYQTSDLSLLGDEIVSNGAVYFSEVSAFNGYSILTALDASRGSILWRHRYNNTGVINLAHPVDESAGMFLQAASSTTLYGTTFTGMGSKVTTTLYAISASHGSLLWQKKVSTNGNMPDEIGGLVIDGVLCLSASPYLYGFDAATGEPKWSVPLDGRAYDSFTSLNGVIYVATTHDQLRPDNSVYEASGSLYAVRVRDGRQLWRYHAQAGVFSPVAQSGLVFVSVSQMDGTSLQSIVALEINSGKVRWTRPMPAGPGAGVEPQITPGKSFLYVNNSDGQIRVWRSLDGKSVDTFSIPAPVKDGPDVVALVTVVP